MWRGRRCEPSQKAAEEQRAEGSNFYPQLAEQWQAKRQKDLPERACQRAGTPMRGSGQSWQGCQKPMIQAEIYSLAWAVRGHHPR